MAPNQLYLRKPYKAQFKYHQATQTNYLITKCFLYLRFRSSNLKEHPELFTSCTATNIVSVLSNFH